MSGFIRDAIPLRATSTIMSPGCATTEPLIPFEPSKLMREPSIS